MVNKKTILACGIYILSLVNLRVLHLCTEVYGKSNQRQIPRIRDKVYLQNGNELEGKILSEEERYISIKVSRARIYTDKKVAISRILQKRVRVLADNPQKNLSEKIFGKLFLKDGSELRGNFKKLSSGDIAVFDHDYLPDNHIIKKNKIKKLQKFQKALVELQKSYCFGKGRCLLLGLVTRKEKSFVILEKISHPDRGFWISRKVIARIKRSSFAKKIKKKIKKRAPKPKKPAGNFLKSGKVFITGGLVKNYGKLENLLPYGVNLLLAYEHDFPSAKRRFAWIPELRLELNFHQFAGERLFQDTDLGLKSIYSALGPVWHFPIRTGADIDIVMGFTGGIGYEKLSFPGNDAPETGRKSLSGAAFVFSPILGLEYTFGKIGLNLQGRFGYSYDSKAPLLFAGVNLGTFYKFF